MSENHVLKRSSQPLNKEPFCHHLEGNLVTMSCPDCFRGHEHPGPTTGTETTLYGHNVYVTEPLERADGEASGLIVIFSDAFGWSTNNLQRLADSYARRTGCRVYIPDFMYGRSQRLAPQTSLRG